MERTELAAVLPNVAAVLPDRMVAKMALNPETGCLLWQGRCTKDGYPQVRDGKQIVYAHRKTFALVHGREIMPLHDLDHLLQGREIAPGQCTARNCCNPYHVEEVPRRVNRVERVRRKVDNDC